MARQSRTYTPTGQQAVPPLCAPPEWDSPWPSRRWMAGPWWWRNELGARVTSPQLNSKSTRCLREGGSIKKGFPLGEDKTLPVRLVITLRRHLHSPTCGPLWKATSLVTLRMASSLPHPEPLPLLESKWTMDVAVILCALVVAACGQRDDKLEQRSAAVLWWSVTPHPLLLSRSTDSESGCDR